MAERKKRWEIPAKEVIAEALRPYLSGHLIGDLLAGSTLARDAFLIEGSLYHCRGTEHLLSGGRYGIWTEVEIDWASLNRHRGHHWPSGHYLFIGVPLGGPAGPIVFDGEELPAGVVVLGKVSFPKEEE